MFSKVRSAALLAVVAAVSVVSGEAQALQPAKVAIINAQKAVADTAEIKKAQAGLETKFRPRQQAVESLQNELQNIQKQLNAGNVDPNREAQLRADGTQKQKELQRLGEDLQADVNAERQDILGRSG